MPASAPPVEEHDRTLPWFGGASGTRDTGARSVRADALFLAAVVLMSCVPYVGGLRLYSDDWAFMAVFDHAAGDSYAQLVAAIMPADMATRPVQALQLSALYAIFGAEPLGYHVFNSLTLATAVVLFHLSLRTLGFSRLLSLLVPLIFGLLPHYSTDRIWIAAYQATASVALYFMSLFADLRFVTREDARRWLWKALGAVALVGSVLAYEVTAPLLLLNALVLGYHARLRQRSGGGFGPRRSGIDAAVRGEIDDGFRDLSAHDAVQARGRGALARRARMPIALAIAGNVALLAVTIGYKFSTTVRADISGGHVLRLLRIVREGVPVHFGEYGIGLPMRVVQVLRSDPSPWGLAVAAFIGIAVAAYLLRAVLPRAADPVRAVRWPALILLGAVLFGVGYGVSLTTWEIGFHATGANNRTAIAAVPGVSCVFVGVVGWLCSLLPSRRARHIGFAVVVGLLAAGSTAITAAVADAWVRAARVQDTVIAAIHAQFPSMDPGTVLLIDGLCPYVGPAPVFVTGWDVTGMLQLEYGQRDVRGDVVKPNTEVTPAGVRTMLFDDVITVYPYGENLYVQHLVTGDVVTLTDEAVARRYFQTVSVPEWPACPPYTDGDGAAIF